MAVFSLVSRLFLVSSLIVIGSLKLSASSYAFSPDASSKMEIMALGQPAARAPGQSVAEYCRSFQFNAESGNLVNWQVPQDCVDYVGNYTTGPQYMADVNFMVDQALKHAATICPRENVDVWVFDVDETLLSNTPYFATQKYGGAEFNATDFNLWVVQGKARAIRPIRSLFRSLLRANWTIYLISERPESQRAVTEKNLRSAGYSGWKKLFMSSESSLSTNGATEVKSKSKNDAFKDLDLYAVQASVGDNGRTDANPNPSPGSKFLKTPNLMYNRG